MKSGGPLNVISLALVLELAKARESLLPQESFPVRLREEGLCPQAASFP